uniref:TIMELESS domain-containing protein n=1 Tax=Heterorhabditis bacteriophora TaxID=37862 RepID=A0A1I7X4I7_HETBA
MEVIIQGAISALGYLEDNIYQPEPDCFETIRDIIRFLRNDNEVLLARRICGERNIIQNDLIPIMKSEKQSDKMFDITLRLMANLVQPTIVSLQGKQPEDRTQWQTYWALDENLIRTKLAFADKDFFIILKEKLEKYFLETEWDNRHEESRLLMERIIVLLRYIFSIPTNDKDNKRTTTEYNSHDRVIESFLESEIHKVLFHIGSQSKERDFHLSILEIFALVVKEHKPADLVDADHERTADEKMRSELELQQAFENEKLKTNVSRKKVMSSRHSRALKDVSKLTFLDERKSKKVTAKNRRHLVIVVLLDNEMLTFIIFFSCGFSLNIVSNCLGIETFHHLQIQLDDYMERAAAQRKEGKYFGIRAQYALSAYKEMILMHQHLLDRGTQEEKNLAQSTCFHILNVEEYRELGCALIRKFMPGSLSKTFLQELVLLTHYYCRLLERSVKSGTLKTIKKKSKIRKPRKGSYHQAPKLPEVDRLSDDDLDERWAELSDELSDVIMGHLEPSENQIPINALLNVEDVEHQKFAMLNVQRAMREMRICDAVGLFRAARDVWLCEERLAEERIRNGELVNDGIEGFSDEMEEDDRSYETKEVDFDFTEYIVKFARTDVLRWYVFFKINVRCVCIFSISFLLKWIPIYFSFVIYRFFATFEKTGEKLVPEILFWKSPKDCYEIEHGYGTYERDKAAKGKDVDRFSLWTEDLEDNLRNLYNEYRDMDERPDSCVEIL